MKGTFVFKQNGEVIDVVENVITNNGKKQLIEHLGRLRDGYAEYMVFGTGNTAASATNTFLEQEVYRCPLHVSRVDTTGYNIVLKSSIDIDAQFRFREFGAIPGRAFVEGTDRDRVTISTFNSDDGWVTGGHSQTKFVSKDNASSFATSTFGTYVKSGSESLVMNYDSAELVQDMDLGGFSNTSRLIMGFAGDVSLSAGLGSSVSFYMDDAETKYATYQFGASTVNTYNSVSVPFSSFTYAGGVTVADLAETKKISLVLAPFGGGSGIAVDQLAIERQEPTNLSDVLFSRATTTEKTKWAGVPLDIEYTVNLGL